jgi:hypothetical protein
MSFRCRSEYRIGALMEEIVLAIIVQSPLVVPYICDSCSIPWSQAKPFFKLIAARRASSVQKKKYVLDIHMYVGGGKCQPVSLCNCPMETSI